MPDQEPRTGGVAVWRTPVVNATPFFRWRYSALASSAGTSEPGRWFPLAEAEALEAAVRRLTRERDEARAERDETYLAGVQQAESLIDPNDPAVRERLIALLHGDTGHAIADDLIAAPISEYADAVLAALRGAK
jgi:hypothetical protein